MRLAKLLQQQTQARRFAVITGAGRGFGEALLPELMDASTPVLAKVTSLGLLESDERRSPTFVSLGGPDLDW